MTINDFNVGDEVVFDIPQNYMPFVKNPSREFDGHFGGVIVEIGGTKYVKQMYLDGTTGLLILLEEVLITDFIAKKSGYIPSGGARFIERTELGKPGGVAQLDSNGNLPGVPNAMSMKIETLYYSDGTSEQVKFYVNESN